MKLFLVGGMIAALMITGCTNTSDRAVLDGYRKSEAQKQLAIDNSIKISRDQILLNAAQRLRAVVKDPNDAEKAVAVLQYTWMARNAVETTKEQYTLGRILTMVTVGNYLYDKQGAFNAIIESLSDDVNRVSQGAGAGNRAAGTTSIRDILNPPATQPSATNDAQNRINTQMDLFNRQLEQLR